MRPARRDNLLLTWAVVAAAGAAACQSVSMTVIPPDASRDASGEAADVPDGGGDATLDASDAAPPGDAAGDAGDAGGEGGPGAACVNATVPPSTLECTGLYSNIVAKTLAPGVRFFQPAVPLWSDGAAKMRWIQLPAGSSIDATDPSEWSFPVGTKVWKEFSRGGKRVETRMFQKVDSGPPAIWVHATYRWNADESAAVTSGGGDITLDGDGGSYHIPTFAECDMCHNGRTDHVLGFEQVSLGLPGAQGLTLAELAQEGLIAPAPAQVQLSIGDDGTGAAGPALAWLHVNCGVCCHNGNSSAFAYGVGMRLRLDPGVLDGRALTSAQCDPLRTTIGVGAATPGWTQPVHWTRIAPGDPNGSLLVQLISNRGTNNPVGGQMPPIGSSIVDTADVAKVVDWVTKLPAPASDAGADAAPEAGGDASAEAGTDAAAAGD